MIKLIFPIGAGALIGSVFLLGIGTIVGAIVGLVVGLTQLKK